MGCILDLWCQFSFVGQFRFNSQQTLGQCVTSGPTRKYRNKNRLVNDWLPNRQAYMSTATTQLCILTSQTKGNNSKHAHLIWSSFQPATFIAQLEAWNSHHYQGLEVKKMETDYIKCIWWEIPFHATQCGLFGQVRSRPSSECVWNAWIYIANSIILVGLQSSKQPDQHLEALASLASYVL